MPELTDIQRDLLALVMGPDGQTIITDFDSRVPPTEFPSALTLHVDRYRIMRLWSAFFVDHPILLTPTWAQPAFAHGADIDQSASGIDLVEKLSRRSGGRIPVVMLTALNTDALRKAAKDRGVVHYLTKPCPDRAVLEAVESSLAEAER